MSATEQLGHVTQLAEWLEGVAAGAGVLARVVCGRLELRHYVPAAAAQLAERATWAASAPPEPLERRVAAVGLAAALALPEVRPEALRSAVWTAARLEWDYRAASEAGAPKAERDALVLGIWARALGGSGATWEVAHGEGWLQVPVGVVSALAQLDTGRAPEATSFDFPGIELKGFDRQPMTAAQVVELRPVVDALLAAPHPPGFAGPTVTPPPAELLRAVVAEVARVVALLPADGGCVAVSAEPEPGARPVIEVTDRPGQCAANRKAAREVVVQGRQELVPEAQANVLADWSRGHQGNKDAASRLRKRLRVWGLPERPELLDIRLSGG